MNSLQDPYQDLLVSEITKLEEVLSLTRSLRDVLDRNVLHSVNEIIAERGEVLELIDGIEKDLVKMLQMNGKNAAYLREQYSDTMDQLIQLVITVQQLDAEIKEVLLERKERIVQDMKHLRLGQILPDEYKRHEHGGSSFIDIRE